MLPGTHAATDVFDELIYGIANCTWESTEYDY